MQKEPETTRKTTTIPILGHSSLAQRKNYNTSCTDRILPEKELIPAWEGGIFYYDQDLIELSTVLNNSLLIYTRLDESWEYNYCKNRVLVPMKEVKKFPLSHILLSFIKNTIVETLTLGGLVPFHAAKLGADAVMLSALWSLLPPLPPKHPRALETLARRNAHFLYFLKYPLSLLTKNFPESCLLKSSTPIRALDVLTDDTLPSILSGTTYHQNQQSSSLGISLYFGRCNESSFTGREVVYWSESLFLNTNHRYNQDAASSFIKTLHERMETLNLDYVEVKQFSTQDPAFIPNTYILKKTKDNLFIYTYTPSTEISNFTDLTAIQTLYKMTTNPDAMK
ncbi:hypothetical protein NEDG_01501 [Nematocida displodere]|uniref:Uncharacterized protein n=1 Tax=Nematocida displodere TaxID=1805483 RepID=A0A177EDC1_9MICR|nr:hypothetical protein NEDG_01501 [Nematocida displodere]